MVNFPGDPSLVGCIVPVTIRPLDRTGVGPDDSDAGAAGEPAVATVAPDSRVTEA